MKKVPSELGVNESLAIPLVRAPFSPPNTNTNSSTSTSTSTSSVKMGHLSTSERVCSKTPMPSTGDSSPPPLLARRAKLSSDAAAAQARRSEDSSPESLPRAKPTTKPTPSPVAAADRHVPNDLVNYIPKDKINMEEYTRNFKGDNVLGWQFKAPLKWDKVIQISLLHIVAVICFFSYPLRQLRLDSTIWCKYNL